MQGNHPGSFEGSTRILSGKSVLFLDFKGLMDIRAQFEGVSFSDYIYIMGHLQSDGDQKTWLKCVLVITITCSQVTNCCISAIACPSSQALNV